MCPLQAETLQKNPNQNGKTFLQTGQNSCLLALGDD